MDKKNLKLGFVHYIGEDTDGLRQYEFIFTDNIDEFFGDDFNEKPAGICNDLHPYEQYCTTTRVVRTNIEFDLIQNNCCFSVADALDGICAICWQNLDNLDTYPEEGRLYFMFGDSYDDVEYKLSVCNILFE